MLPDFLNFTLGFFIQILPLTCLVVYPLLPSEASARKRVMTTFLLIMLAESLLFGLACFPLMKAVPPGMVRLNLADVLFLLCLFPQAVYYFRKLTSPLAEKVFLLFFGLIWGNFAASSSNLLYYYLFPNVIGNYMPYCLESDLILFVFGSLTAVFALLFLKRFYLPVREMASRREFFYFSLLSIILFLIIGSGLTFLDSGYFDNPLMFFLFFALFVAVTVIFLICLLMFQAAQEKFIAQNQLQQIQNNQKLNQEQYEKIYGMMEQNRKIRHDFRHHVIALRGMIERNEGNRAIQYIDQYDDSLKGQEYGQYCLHPIINTLINYYRTQCENQGITFHASVEGSLAQMDPVKLPIHDTDLTVILGNLLDNALTAASEKQTAGLHSPFLRLNLLCHGSALVITLDNSFGEERKIYGNGYSSTKEGHIGIGLASIRAVAQKYDGGTEFSHENGIFHSSVMLPFRENF